MIGRGALSTPWLFRDVWHYLCTGEHAAPLTLEEKIATIRRYFRLMREQRDDRYALFQINRRISWFAKRLQRTLENGKMESVKPFKETVRGAKTAQEVEDALDLFLAGGLRGGLMEEAAEEAV